ncbi:MAG: cysteine desulfurase family protein [Candidatus Cybelea sp.]
MKSERIYLDNAATTPLRAEVGAAVREAEANYNPSSLHAEGRRARAALDSARERIASLLGVRRNEIVFTASGTESDNLAVLGVARAAVAGAHVVTTAVEHHAVLGALDRLRVEGFETTLLPVASDGRVDPGEFEAALRPSTILASVMYANNEIGTVQPIAELALIARRRGVFLHTDAVQAASWLPLGVPGLGVDLLTLSAHKFGGPRGIGLLYAGSGVPLTPTIYGGGQEFGRRSGTQNLPGIVGMALALELAASERARVSDRVAPLRDRLEAGILAGIPDVRINGAAPRLPNYLNVSFAGVDSAALLIALDLAGIAVSAGSACTSGSLEASHVLGAMSLEERWQTSAIRFTLGVATSSAEIDRVLDVLPSTVAGLRSPATSLRGDG